MSLIPGDIASLILVWLAGVIFGLCVATWICSSEQKKEDDESG